MIGNYRIQQQMFNCAMKEVIDGKIRYVINPIIKNKIEKTINSNLTQDIIELFLEYVEKERR